MRLNCTLYKSILRKVDGRAALTSGRRRKEKKRAAVLS